MWADRPAVPAFDLATAGANPEGIKFLQRGSRLFVLAANGAAGTVSLLRHYSTKLPSQIAASWRVPRDSDERLRPAAEPQNV